MSLYHDILQQIYPNKPIECFWLCVNGFDIRIYPVHESDLRFGRTGVKVCGSFAYDHTDEKLIKEETILGYIDAIAIYQDALALNLSDWNVEKFNNNGLYHKKSIFE